MFIDFHFLAFTVIHKFRRFGILQGSVHNPKQNLEVVTKQKRSCLVTQSPNLRYPLTVIFPGESFSVRVWVILNSQVSSYSQKAFRI